MQIIDIILGGLILFGVFRGFIKGLFVQIAAITSLVLGIYGAIHFSNFVAHLLSNKTSWNNTTINIVSFAITFIIIVLLITIAGKAFTKLADFAAIGLLNKILGAIFGGVKIALILSVLLNIFDKFNNVLTFLDEDTKEEAVFYKPIQEIVPTFFPNILNVDAAKSHFSDT